MTTAGLVAFNLLLNGLGSFAVAWLVVRAARFAFRPGAGRALVALACLPFLKVAADLAHGVPDGSFLWLRARGVPQDLGSFQLGFGARWLVPHVNLTLGALSGGQLYTQSAPDLIAAGLSKKVSPWAPGVIAALLLGVGLARLALRALAWLRAERERRKVSRRASLAGRRRVGWRTVSIFVAEGLAGSPFTGGIVAPYVCFPRRVWDSLSPGERRAAVAHELAHVAEHHVMITTLVGIVRDLFWFVPFIGVAERRLREACELAADARAVRGGVLSEVLASALVRAREAMAAPSPGRAAATLAANETSLSVRVGRLMGTGPAPRLGFQHRAVRVALTAWVAATALGAVAFGNH